MASISALVGVVPHTVSPAAAAASTPVMAPNRLSAGDLAGWYKSTGKTNHATVSVDTLASYFISEGADEGVTGDVAFAQSMVETGYLAFSDRVPPSYNNFSGLGAVDGGSGAAQFPNARTGVRAQIQHLRAYGDPTVTEAKLHHPLVDPRFNLVSPKGKAPTWDQFGHGIWASDPDYASKVLTMYGRIRDWAAIHNRWAPFDTPARLVQQGYRDLLFREPSAARVWTWVDALNKGSMTPAGFLASLVAREGIAHAQPVTRVYLAALGRLPDRGGLAFWTRRHYDGFPLLRQAEQFVASSEFARRFGQPDDPAFVDLLYQNVLGRPGDPGGRDYWVRRLQSGAISRAGLVLQFSESDEYVRSSRPTVETAEVDLGMLLRPPTAEEIWLWADRRAHGAGIAELTGQTLTSDAYAARFA